MRPAPPVGRILLLCVADPSEEPHPEFPPLVSQFHLHDLPDAADYHGVTGFVYHALKGMEVLDTEVWARLETFYTESAASRLQTMADLARLHEVLRGEAIPWLVIGGPALAEVAYPRPDLRTYREIQLLVPAGNLGACHRAVEADSGRMGDESPRAQNAGPVELVLRYGTRATIKTSLGADGGRVSTPVAADEILARRQRVNLGTLEIDVPDPADSIVALATGVWVDGGVRLGELVDLRQALRGRPRWEDVIGRADAHGISALVSVALRRAREAVGADVPDDVLTALATTFRSHAPGGGTGGAKAAPPTHKARSMHLTPAEDLLLALLRPVPEWSPRSTDGDVWPEVVSLALTEGLAPLVYGGLSALSSGAPVQARQALREAYDTATATAAQAYYELADVLSGLYGGGVTPVLFKGGALARFTYRDPGLRPFSDLDLLVRKGQIDDTHRILRSLGYALYGEEPTEADRTWRHGRGYYDPHGHRFSIDVHWRYAGYPYVLDVDTDAVFGRAREVLLPEERVLVLAPADDIVALAISFLRELWYRKPRLRYARDVVEVMRCHDVDWDVVRRSGADPLIRSALHVTLAVAADLLDAPVPAEVWAALAPRRYSGITQAVLRRIGQGVMRRQRSAEAVLQAALLRWLAEGSLLRTVQWLKLLAFVPAPLAPSQRRWLARILRR